MRRFQIDCGGQTTGDKDAIVLDVQGEARNVNLRVDYITRGMLGNIPELLGDLLEISAYVFCADQRASRGSDQLTDYGRDWRRDMRFNIPVRCPDVWSDASVQEELRKTLGFLSDDAYTFEFTLSENPAEIQEQYFPNLIDAAPSVDEVALFSGGIDSFAGAVNDIVKNNKSLLLVGHFGASKIRNVQDALVKGLEERGYNQQASFVPILVSNVKARTVEDTQRTRSFLFACLGLVIAQMAGKDRFTFYENGIVSLNPPVSGDILGGRATRTTHPRVLRGLERLFSLILEREISIDTPLQWMTKPEVVLLIKDAGMSDLLPTTCSCTRTHSRTKAQPHCGECSQCIDRRFAVLAAEMEEYEPASTYCLDLLTSDRTGDEKLRMALNYVAFFNKLRGVPQNRFIAEYSEFVSALGEFPGLTTQEVGARLFDMFQRQAVSIDSVMVKALRDNAEALVKGEILPGSLLALSRNVENVAIQPPSDYDAQAKDFRDRLDSIAAPIFEFSVDERNNHILFRNGLMLDGADYTLVEKLLASFRAAKNEEKEAEYISAPDLAKVLGKTEQSIRQQRSRIGKKLASLAADLGIPLNEDSFIENLHSEGYRLNPNLREVALADIKKKGPPPTES